MGMSQAITETVVLLLREGVELDSATSGSDADRSPDAQVFSELVNTVKAQPGCLSQFWGHQVEDKTRLVWCINWESPECHATFMSSAGYQPFLAKVGEVCALELEKPVILHTRWTSDADAAFKSPVTEVAFFGLSEAPDEAAKTTIADSLVPIIQTVKRVCNAAGAIGWAAGAVPGVDMVPGSKGDVLHGAFGYASIADHMKWRDHPEHGKAAEIFGDLEKKGLALRPADVPGIDPKNGYVHVKFQTDG